MYEQKSFKKLVVWQKAYGLAQMIYKHSQNFPSAQSYGLTLQIRRAGVSVMASIAEESERQHKKEFLQFLSVARGSLAEVETYLMFAKDLAHLNQKGFNSLEEQRQEVGRLLTGLYRSLS